MGQRCVSRLPSLSLGCDMGTVYSFVATWGPGECAMRTMSRRRVLGLLGAAGAAAVTGQAGADQLRGAPSPGSSPATQRFLWGAATAGHQVEGNLVNDECWLLEHLDHSMFKEPSGDACDHYHRFEADIAMLASFGLNSYRFSVEWSRIEPAEGAFSNAELGHYRAVLDACHARGITPLVTYNHVAVPAWFARDGGWENPQAPARFARYCGVVTKHLGDLIGYAATLNEPNLPMLFKWIQIPHLGTLSEMTRGGLPGIRAQLREPHFSNEFTGDPDRMTENMLVAHAEARKAIKAERSALPVGFTLAIEDDQAPPPSMHMASGVEEKRRQVYDPWFKLARGDDYIGVQNYTRTLVGKSNLEPEAGKELTQSGYEFYPEALEHTIRLTAKATRIPILVTENGLATTDDTRRVEFIRRAVAGMERCRADGIDVRAYIHWSLLDNFEWVSGDGQTFGLVAVDRTTQKRSPKPSALFLGEIARRSV